VLGDMALHENGRNIWVEPDSKEHRSKLQRVGAY
jgi:hypothetical protein